MALEPGSVCLERQGAESKLSDATSVDARPYVNLKGVVWTKPSLEAERNRYLASGDIARRLQHYVSRAQNV